MVRRNWRWRQMAVAAVVHSTGFLAVVESSSAQQLAAPLPEISLTARADKARSLANAYSEKLRAGVIQALKDGGPVGAIGACNTLAPELNTTITAESAFEIGRTAFRVRNPDNAPDAWELAGLENFQKALTAGGDAKTMETYDVVSTKEGQKLFRYMRPIMMREPCMSCHGPGVAQDVKAEIAKYYTDDKAIGFNLGELRGAFSLVQQLD
jgi:Protein of unknown function (DUF3365)